MLIHESILSSKMEMLRYICVFQVSLTVNFVLFYSCILFYLLHILMFIVHCAVLCHSEVLSKFMCGLVLL